MDLSEQAVTAAGRKLYGKLFGLYERDLIETIVLAYLEADAKTSQGTS